MLQKLNQHITRYMSWMIWRQYEVASTFPNMPMWNIVFRTTYGFGPTLYKTKQQIANYLAYIKMILSYYDPIDQRSL